MPKTIYCWRCKADVPMLDEAEWQWIHPFLQDGLREIKEYRQRHEATLHEAQEHVLGQGALDRYFEMTGHREANVEAIWHHRLSQFGPPCRRCDKPLRTPMAKLCAECGASVESPESALSQTHISEIEQRVAVIRSMSGFDDPAWWLTFYLVGSPEKLEGMVPHLAAMRAVNLEGAAGGFLYPKIPVNSSPAAVSALVLEVVRLATTCGVEITAVDADTTADRSTCQFEEIIRYDPSSR